MIYPRVQKNELTGALVEVKSVCVSGDFKEIQERVFKEYLIPMGDGIKIEFNKTEGFTEEEKYILTVKESTISAEICSEKGAFRAAHTIGKLIKKNELKTGTLEDYPLFRKRGYIEGFYGPTWENKKRISVMKLMASYGMNTFYYAPKDDIYHREKWRELYPEKELAELKALFDLANDMENHPAKYAEICKGKKLATCFYEPSTRTRLSFEAAMLNLGGSVLGFSDAGSSSASKGESVSDTIRVISGYADICAMRHPKEGAPMVASMNTDIPVINAGDGGHNHPTQTLTDLLTIQREKGRFDNLTIGFCGDLKFGRTVHSLIGAMSRYKNVKFVLISPEELKVPEYIKQTELEAKNLEYIETTSLEDAMPKLDILYMTRVQRERFFNEQDYIRLKDSYILTPQKLETAKNDLSIMHPLPRVNEISVAVDKDPRACYFKQVNNGKFIRMALIMKLLEVK